MPILYHRFIEKQGSKRNMIQLNNPDNLKIIFALLIKTVAIII